MITPLSGSHRAPQPFLMAKSLMHILFVVCMLFVFIPSTNASYGLWGDNGYSTLYVVVDADLNGSYPVGTSINLYIENGAPSDQMWHNFGLYLRTWEGSRGDGVTITDSPWFMDFGILGQSGPNSGSMTLRFDQPGYYDIGFKNTIQPQYIECHVMSLCINIYVPNMAPNISLSATPSSVAFGQSINVSSTATDSEGGLAFHGILALNPAGSDWLRSPAVDHSTGWGNHPASPFWTSVNYSSGVCSGSSNTRTGIFVANLVGTHTFHANAHDGELWSTSQHPGAYVYVTVNKATPNGTFYGGTKTPGVGSSGYTVTAGDLISTFTNPYSANVAVPSGSASYSIAPGSPNGSAGTPIIAGSQLPGGGTYLIRATYPGDGNYTSKSLDATFTVNKATQNLVSITSANLTSYGTPYTAVAAGGNGTGSIVWSLGSGSTAIGAAINSSTGAVTANSTGTVIIRAYRAADQNFNQSATTADYTVTFGPRPITVTLSGSKSFDNSTSPAGATATITSGSLPSGDTIAFNYANTSSSNAGSYNGLVTSTITSSTAPTARTSYYAISYDGNYTINKGDQTITFPNPGNRNYTSFPQSFALTASASSGLAPTLTVTSGNATVSGSTITISAAGSITVQATQSGNSNLNSAPPISQTFNAIQVWDLTVAAGTGGTAGTTGLFPNGASAPLTATPTAGYRFGSWTGASGIASPSSSTTTVSMTATKSVTANFIKVHSVTLSAGVGGSVSGGGLHDLNGNPSISASPNAGYRFVNWTGPDVGLVANANSATTTVNVTKDINLTANFIRTFTLTVTSNAGGSGGGSGTYDAGSTAYASVTVSGGYLFAGWTGPNSGLLSTQNASPASIIMNGDYSVNANVISTASVVDLGVLDVGEAVISSSPTGNKNSQRDIIMQSTGNVAVSVSDYILDSSTAPGEFTLAAAPQGVIAAGGSTVSTVNFRPGVTTGTRTGRLLILSDDPAMRYRSYSLTAVAIPPPQTISFAQPADKTYGNVPFNLTATSTSGLPVSFSILSGPATISGGIVTLTGNGTVVVRASQAGNASWAPAPNVDRSFNVSKADITVTLAGSKMVDGSAIPTSALASITSGSLAPGDTISYSYSNTSAWIPGNYSGLTTVTVSNATAPTNRTSSYNISNIGTYSISKASPSITFPSITDTYVGQAKSLSGSLSGGFSPTGSITYTILSTSGGATGSISPATTFNALTLTTGNPGSVTIRANYAGDASNNPVIVDRVVNIPNREPSAVSGGVVNSISFGNPVSIPVNLTDPDGNCNGYTVQIYNPSSGWGPAVPYSIANTSSQSINFAHTPTGAGTWQYRFAAVDAVGVTGTTQYTLSVIVNKATTTTTASFADALAVANRFPSDVFTLTSATKSNVTNANVAVPSYSVQSLTNLTGSSLSVGAAVTSPFTIGGTATRPGYVADHGEADAYATISILVTYLGDANYLPSSTIVSFTVVNSTYTTDLRVRAYPADVNLKAWLLPSSVAQNNYTLQRVR